MSAQISTTLCLLIALLPLALAHADSPGDAARSACSHCHMAKREGFNSAHSFAANNCVSCHAGNNTADNGADAHAGLIAFPGELDTAMRACGACHADKVSAVRNNLMHTGHGIVAVTRKLIDGSSGPDETVNFQSLGHSVADSLLRKQCASCHLGQEKSKHQLDVMRDRGGGCVACHVNDYPESGHPALTTKVSDARCFGCHARSGRISLSYTGFAEIDESAGQTDQNRLRLADRRTVVRKPADVHYLAGMSCIDCHTGVGLMGDGQRADHQRQAVDISCTDCHFDTESDGKSAKPLSTSKKNTPLPQLEIRANGVWLHTKNTGRELRVPSLDPQFHADDPNHQRLECATCHSQWAPQCFGCHIEYDADGSQWDHIEQRETAGRWSEERSRFRHGLPALGVNTENRIELFVPGMIMTVAHPSWESDKLVRVFAPLSPHTSGPSRTCKSCHRSSEALGLGEGEIIIGDGRREFVPTHEALQDDLPADAWTNLERSLGGRTPINGQRPLTKDEMNAVLDALLPCGVDPENPLQRQC